MIVYFVRDQIACNNQEPSPSVCIETAISQNKILSANEPAHQSMFRLKGSGGDDGEHGFHVTQCKWYL